MAGEALRRHNAPAIASVLAAKGGDLVTATAGHHMEARLAAYGSGVARASREAGARILTAGIDGGTTKLALIENRQVRATADVHICGRLQVTGADGVIERPAPAGRDHARRAGSTGRSGAPSGRRTWTPWPPPRHGSWSVRCTPRTSCRSFVSPTRRRSWGSWRRGALERCGGVRLRPGAAGLRGPGPAARRTRARTRRRRSPGGTAAARRRVHPPSRRAPRSTASGPAGTPGTSPRPTPCRGAATCRWYAPPWPWARTTPRWTPPHSPGDSDGPARYGRRERRGHGPGHGARPALAGDAFVRAAVALRPRDP